MEHPFQNVKTSTYVWGSAFFFFFKLVWLRISERVYPTVHALSQHLSGFNFQLKPRLLL